MGIVVDVAQEILKHVHHPDEGFIIWHITMQTNSYRNTLHDHSFELRCKNHDVMYLKSMRTGMMLDLSTVKSNVTISCCSHLNLKSQHSMKALDIYFQLHIESSSLIQPPKINNVSTKTYNIPEDEQFENSRFHVYRLHYVELLEEIVKLCIGFKKGYFNQIKE